MIALFGISGPWEWILLFVLLCVGLFAFLRAAATGAARLKREPLQPAPLPGQRWEIANGPTIEIASVSTDSKTLIARYPDGTEQRLPSQQLRRGAVLLPAE